MTTSAVTPDVDTPTSGSSDSPVGPPPPPEPVAPNAADSQPTTQGPVVDNIVQGMADDANSQRPQFDSQRPNVWRRLVEGALSGLRGGAVGSGVGAIQAATQSAASYSQDKLDAAQAHTNKISMQSAQAGMLLADAHRKAMEVDALPEDIKNRQTSAELDNANRLQAAGYVPISTSENSNEGAQSAAEMLTQVHGGVPPVFVAHLPGTADAPDGLHRAYKLNEDQAQDVSLVNGFADISGGPEFNQQTWSQLPQTLRDKYKYEAMSGGHGLEVSTDATTAHALALKYGNWADSYGQKSNHDDATLAQLRGYQARYQKDESSWNNAANSQLQKTTDITSQGKLDAKGAPRSDSDPVIAVDPQQGNVVTTRAAAEAAGQFHYKADPAKVNALVAGMNDVQTKLNQLADVVNSPAFKPQTNAIGGAADSSFNAPLAGALLESKGLELSVHGGGAGIFVPTGRVNAGQYAKNISNANQITRDYVIATLGAHEAISQLPRLQTFGQSSRMTQQQMESAQAMLPVPGDDPASATQKMDSLQGTIDPLRKQIPKMPGAPLLPSYRERK